MDFSGIYFQVRRTAAFYNHTSPPLIWIQIIGWHICQRLSGYNWSWEGPWGNSCHKFGLGLCSSFLQLLQIKIRPPTLTSDRSSWDLTASPHSPKSGWGRINGKVGVENTQTQTLLGALQGWQWLQVNKHSWPVFEGKREKTGEKGRN